MRTKVYCEQCDHRVDYEVKDMETTRQVKELDLTLTVPVAHCRTCGAEVFVKEIDAKAQHAFFDEYRKRQGLISASTIRNMRKKLGLSQRDMARLLGLGEITIARYELGSIPSRANSMLLESLRSRHTLITFFEDNAAQLSEHGREALQTYLKESNPLLYTGHRKFSIDKFHALTALLVSLCEASDDKCYTTKLNKLLFYCDFGHHYKHGQSITGSKYLRLSYGPVPNKYDFKYDKNPYLVAIVEENGIRYALKKPFESSSLKQEEIEMAHTIYNQLGGRTSLMLSDLSHHESAWLNTESGECISYTHSQELSLSL